MLSPEELLNYRTSKSQNRSLPGLSAKVFSPSGTEEEKSYIEQTLQERIKLLREERVERRDLLSKAEWEPRHRLARVVHRVGNYWDFFGFQKDGHVYLYPEEALFLTEIVKLEVLYSGTPLSVQQCYQLLLNPQCCASEQYRVFAHLSRHGFHVKRASVRKRKLSQDDNQATKSKRMKDAEFNDASLTCASSSSRANLLNQIPDFSRGDCMVQFEDLSLLPNGIRPERNTYLIRKSNIMANISLQYRSQEKACTSSSLESKYDTHNKQLSAGAETLNKIQPLLNAPVSEDVLLEKLNIFKKPNASAKSEGLRVIYDVFSPSKHFRKSDPGLPAYQVAILNNSCPFPNGQTIQKTLQQCLPGVGLILSHVQQNGSVSFYQVTDRTFSPLNL